MVTIVAIHILRQDGLDLRACAADCGCEFGRDGRESEDFVLFLHSLDKF